MLRKLKCLIDACASQYNDVHYHSVVHGTHVLLNTAYLIHEWDKYMSKEEGTYSHAHSVNIVYEISYLYVSAMYIFAIYILIHLLT